MMESNNVQKCNACGSNRVVVGRVRAGDAPFEFSDSDLKEERYWTSIHFHNTARYLCLGNTENATLCFDCGKLEASFKVDIKEAKKIVDRWGSDALKARLG
jgi:hypothetical protein